jgi:hypothetical protein
VDRGKPGSKMHILSDANGLPLLVGLSAANTHDSQALKPMITGHQTRHDPHHGHHFKPQRASTLTRLTTSPTCAGAMLRTCGSVRGGTRRAYLPE